MNTVCAFALTQTHTHTDTHTQEEPMGTRSHLSSGKSKDPHELRSFVSFLVSCPVLTVNFEPCNPKFWDANPIIHTPGGRHGDASSIRNDGSGAEFGSLWMFSYIFWFHYTS